MQYHRPAKSQNVPKIISWQLSRSPGERWEGILKWANDNSSFLNVVIPLCSITLINNYNFPSNTTCNVNCALQQHVSTYESHHQAVFKPLNPELNPICYLLALLGAHHFLHVSRIRVKILTFRRLISYIYIYMYGVPILDVSRSHTTTQHSR